MLAPAEHIECELSVYWLHADVVTVAHEHGGLTHRAVNAVISYTYRGHMLIAHNTYKPCSMGNTVQPATLKGSTYGNVGLSGLLMRGHAC